MSSAERVVIVGSGGLAREALGHLRDQQSLDQMPEFLGFVSLALPNDDTLIRIGARWLGTDEEFLPHPGASHFLLGVGDPTLRRRLAKVYVRAGLTPLTIIHPTATIGNDVVVGEGSLIGPNVSITTNVQLACHVVVDRSSTIGHDTQIGRYSVVHPGAVISGNVSVSDECRIGANSCLLEGISVGPHSTVGAGAVVTRDVRPEVTVAGVPAKVID